ncbi:MAG: glutamyl-tRNA reductase [Elusimicrobia bacterium]|nr:glutamyl-tRNA reductase [Elusimicrobiota bacterium]
MRLAVVGLSHHTAPLELREKLSFGILELGKFIESQKEKIPVKELMILSTCNRTEIYTFAEEKCDSWAKQFLIDHSQNQQIDKFFYLKQEEEMVIHLFNVASGLDSLVLGENEILKQVKDSYHLFQKSGWTGKFFNVLFQRALYVGKLVRTHTGISQGLLSSGSVAVSLAEKIFGDLRESSVLILGAGKMAGISARYLASKKVKKLFVANRTLETAQTLAHELHAQPLSLEEGLKRAESADILITSLSLAEPLLSKKEVQDLMKKRENRSFFIIDIGVPRNVDPSVHDLDNVYLYNIDDLKTIVQENIEKRSREIENASIIVKEKAKEFFQWHVSVKEGAEKSLKHNSSSIPGCNQERI